MPEFASILNTLTTGEVVTAASFIFGAGGIWYRIGYFGKKVDRLERRVDQMDKTISNGLMEKFVLRREWELTNAREHTDNSDD
ncbi:MAG: hypothetical protein KAI97_07095 [Gemmatimonadetes bacterium]|nr:hypothetical protein [Gemmatimonadota bacterium]